MRLRYGMTTWAEIHAANKERSLRVRVKDLEDLEDLEDIVRERNLIIKEFGRLSGEKVPLDQMVKELEAERELLYQEIEEMRLKREKK